MGDIGQIKNDLADFVEIMRKVSSEVFPKFTEAINSFSAKRIILTNAQHREYKKMKKEQEEMIKSTEEVIKITTKYSEVSKTIEKSNKGLARSFAGLSHENKTWTFVSRMVSGSPFWRLQNKIRGISDGLAIFFGVQDKGMDRMIESVEVLNEMDDTVKKLEENIKNIEKTDIFAAFGGDTAAATKFYEDKIDKINKARTEVDASMAKDRKRRERVEGAGVFGKPLAKLTNFAGRTWDFIKGISKGVWTIIKFAGRGLFIFAKVILIATLIAMGFYLLKKAYDRGGTFTKVVDDIYYALKLAYEHFVNVFIPAIIQFGTGFFNLVSGAFTLINALLTGNVEKIESSVNKIIKSIGDILVGVFKMLIGLIPPLMIVLSSLALSILAGIATLTMELITTLPQALGMVFEAILIAVFDRYGEKAKSAGERVGEFLIGAGIASAAVSLTSAAIPALAVSTPVGLGIAALGGAAYLGIKHYQSKSAATGANFITSGPTPLMVGDNPGGREHVQVTPLSSANINGPKGGNVINVHVNGRVGASDSELNDIAKKVGKLISREISRSTSTNARF